MGDPLGKEYSSGDSLMSVEEIRGLLGRNRLLVHQEVGQVGTTGICSTDLVQERGVAAWERDRLPLLFHHDRLVWVPGIGIDCAYQCAREDNGIMPRWAAISMA